ncbi:MAG: AAA family ATPase [Proteobacteria bacterium]|nr:AAA family ATPase [Pseudomonadota bacterium]
MRITQLSMDGFGVFNDVTITDLPEGLILFLGDNEEGKSTLHSFIQTVLFGYPDRRTGKKSYPPLSGGNAGGRLHLNTDSRGLVTVARTDGPKGGAVVLTFEDGETGSGSSLEKILGGTNQTTFQNLYGFSLTELQSIESLTSEEVRDVIYGASLGTGLHTLTEARKRLKKRMDSLFKSSGSKPEMNDRLRVLEETRKELKEAKTSVGEYETTGEEIDRLSTEIAKNSEETKRTRERQSRVAAWIKLWDDWIALQEAETEIKDLDPKVDDFPVDGLTKLPEIKNQLKRQQADLQDTEDERKNKSQQLEELSYDENLLKQSAEIEGLIQGLETYEKNNANIPDSEDRIEESQAGVVAVLKDLGAGWTEQRALDLDRSAHVKEEIAKHKRNLEQNEEKSKTLTAKRDSRVTAFEEAQEERNRAGEKIEELKAADLDVDRAVLERLRNGKEQFSSVLADLPRGHTEHKEALEAMNRTLREINPGWSLQDLEKVDTSLPARERIEQFDQQLGDVQNDVHSAKTRLNIAEDAISNHRRASDDKQTSLEALGGDSVETSAVETRLSMIRKLRQTVRDHQAIERQLAGAIQQQGRIGAGDGPDHVPNPGRFLQFIAVIVAVVGVLLFFAFSSMDQQMFAIASVIGAGLIALVLLLQSRTRSQPSSDDRHSEGKSTGPSKHIEKLQGQLDEMTNAIKGVQEQLKIRDSLNLTTVDQLVDETEDQLRLARDRDGRIEDLRQSEKDRDAAKKTLETVQKKVTDTDKEWQEHARSLGLPAAIKPSTAGLVFEKVEKALSEKRGIEGISRRIKEMEGCRTDYLEVMSKVPRLEIVLKDKDDVILGALSKFLAEIDQQEERRAKLERAREALEEAEKRASAADDKRVQAEADLKEAHKVMSSAADAWNQWLADHDMDSGWSPDTASHALDRVIRLVEIVGDRTTAENEVARATEEAQQYRQRVSNVFAALDRTTPQEQEIPDEIRRLNEDRIQHEESRTRHGQLSGEISGIDSRCSTSQKRIEQDQAEFDQLIQDGSAKNEEEFLLRGQFHEKLRSLKSKIATCESAIRKVAGTNNLEEVKAELADQNIDGLRAEEGQLSGRVTQLESDRSNALQKKGAAEKKREDLDSDNRVAVLRAKEEGLLEELADNAHDWARHAVAQYLLDTARERHAEANQPRVIQEASKYFSTITDGRYTKVFAPPGENSMQVIDQEGRNKESDNLSRGSMEQLYLAIRFGYISAQSTDTEALPILMDDVLVNFDPTRSAAAAATILQMAKQRQVLFFTCHPWQVEIFRRCSPEVPVYVMANESIALRQRC